MESKHIYDWLDEPAINDAEASAKEWLNEFCKPAHKKNEAWLETRKVTAMWKGKRWHVSGASCMGDVWLRGPKSYNFYDHRIDLEELSEWQCVILPVDPYPPKVKSSVATLIAMAVMAGGACSGIFGNRNLSSWERHDPKREKTAEDLERMEAARQKKKRKEEKRNKN